MARLKQQLTFLLFWFVNTAAAAAVSMLLHISLTESLGICFGSGLALAALELSLYHKLRDE